MSGFSLSQAVRAGALIVPFVACLVAGCAEGPLDRYPGSLQYPARADLLVLEVPKDTPFVSYPPGQLDQSVARLKDLGGKTFDPKDAPAAQRKELDEQLTAIFGTPRNPIVFSSGPGRTPPPSNEATEFKKTLALDNKTLRTGSGLYRRHCLHCHGVSGDGRGPTGPWVDPHPRDYRQGTFKFISTGNELPHRKARRDDLLRTLHKGIEGTSMPSFGLLPDNELNALASYVIHLSIRGEVEFQVLSQLQDGAATFKHPNPEKDEDLALPAYIEAYAAELLSRWAQSTTSEPNKIEKPGDTTNEANGAAKPESVVRGYKKFIEPAGDAACLSCHVDFGRQAYFRYDKWGTLARPANLTVPVYRGGRRPLDIYWRIAGGIEGCGMPANKTMTKDQYWDLVNFVQALPYPGMLPDEIRDKVYVPDQVKNKEHAEGTPHR